MTLLAPGLGVGLHALGPHGALTQQGRAPMGQDDLTTAEHNLINLVYAITVGPRLFRWHSGQIEWASPSRWRRPRWHTLPMKVAMTLRPSKLGEGWWQAVEVSDAICHKCGRAGLDDIGESSALVIGFDADFQANALMAALCHDCMMQVLGTETT